ncbi:DUF302 domain-containing protein [Zobellia alginiliquefaciens]|uniref:DUF302 domain-containing protein n=1 Tax=Zobellia alginiliquefaciens TaxID=3032586 RepID=UPI0023E2882A|nr:DUF302 domain-containing protein [Zobellia alginiliquefaciens]
MNLKFFMSVCLVLAFIACDEDETNEPEKTDTAPNVVGMNFLKSTQSFDETYAVLKASLEANENITIVAEVNHTANAASAELELNPTKIIFFGNPNLGTPLMQVNQQAGLDLPQRILVYQSDSEEVYIGYNSTTYLANRHTVGDVSTLSTMAGALRNLSENAGIGEVTEQPSEVPADYKVLTVVSQETFDATYEGIMSVIEGNPNLKIVAELDHQANAANVELELLPTSVIIFGNPSLGTPLMQDKQTSALDLPQKILVYENAEGEVKIAFNSPELFMSRHGVTDNDATLETILAALQGIATSVNQ